MIIGRPVRAALLRSNWRPRREPSIRYPAKSRARAARRRIAAGVLLRSGP